MTNPEPSPEGAAPAVPAAPAAPAAAPAKHDPGITQHEALPGVLADSPRPRDDRGRFAPKSETAPPADSIPADASVSAPAASGVATMSDNAPAPAPTAAPATAVPAPPPSKFKVGRLEFDSQDHAEQAHRTLQGLHRKQKDENNELRLRILELERASARQTVPSAPDGASAGPAAEPEPEGIDWSVFDHLQRHNGPAVAQRWLAQEQERLVTARTESLVAKSLKALETKFAPIAQIQQTLERATVMDQTINSLRAYKYPDGSAAYPELDSPEALREVRQLWIEMKFPEEMLSTPTGLHAAVEVYRGALMRRAGATSPRTPSPAPAVPAVVPSPVVSSDGSRPAAAPGAARKLTTAERILKAPLSFDDQLGFSA